MLALDADPTATDDEGMTAFDLASELGDRELSTLISDYTRKRTAMHQQVPAGGHRAVSSEMLIASEVMLSEQSPLNSLERSPAPSTPSNDPPVKPSKQQTATVTFIPIPLKSLESSGLKADYDL